MRDAHTQRKSRSIEKMLWPAAGQQKKTILIESKSRWSDSRQLLISFVFKMRKCFRRKEWLLLKN
jgi:hypothetical protein